MPDDGAVRVVAAPTGAPVCLVILTVAARADFAVTVLGRKPDFDVVGLRSGVADVSRREDHDPVRKRQKLEDPLGGTEQKLQLLVALLRDAELHQLDLVELVLPEHPPHVAPVRARLPAKTGRVRDVMERKIALLQDLAGVQIGQRDLRGRDQPQIVRRTPVLILGEFRKLPRPPHGGTVDQHRRHDLPVAVLRRVQIEHEVDESPFESRSRPLQNGETALRKLRPPLEIHDVQSFPQLPVRPGRKRKRLGFTPSSDLDIVAFVLANRNALVQPVGHEKKLFGERLLHNGELPIQLLDPLPRKTHLLHQSGGVLSLSFHLPHGAGAFVPLRLELLDPPQDIPSPGFEDEQRIQIEAVPAFLQQSPYLLRFLSYPFRIEHQRSSLPSAPARRARTDASKFAVSSAKNSGRCPHLLRLRESSTGDIIRKYTKSKRRSPLEKRRARVPAAPPGREALPAGNPRRTLRGRQVRRTARKGRALLPSTATPRCRAYGSGARRDTSAPPTPPAAGRRRGAPRRGRREAPSATPHHRTIPRAPSYKRPAKSHGARDRGPRRGLRRTRCRHRVGTDAPASSGSPRPCG